MNRNKQIFGVGLVVGIIVASLFCLFFAPRYMVENSGASLVKLDRWSGECWRYSDGNWEKIEKFDHDWKKIDAALRNALNLKTMKSDAENELSKLLSNLKKKYPVLGNLNDEDILERINIVYSKAIITDLYLQNIQKIENSKQ